MGLCVCWAYLSYPRIWERQEGRKTGRKTDETDRKQCEGVYTCWRAGYGVCRVKGNGEQLVCGALGNCALKVGLAQGHWGLLRAAGMGRCFLLSSVPPRGPLQVGISP